MSWTQIVINIQSDHHAISGQYKQLIFLNPAHGRRPDTTNMNDTTLSGSLREYARMYTQVIKRPQRIVMNAVL